MMAPWAYKPVAMSVLATPTYNIVTMCHLLIVMIEANLAWRPIRFTSAMSNRLISRLVTKSVELQLLHVH
jgi:hypothetical protein